MLHLVKMRDIAILARTRRTLFSVDKVLKSRKIPTINSAATARPLLKVKDVGFPFVWGLVSQKLKLSPIAIR